MSEGFEIFRLLAGEWAFVAESRGARRVVWEWGETSVALCGMCSPAELLAACNRRGSPSESAGILRAVLLRADEPLAARTVLQALVPGMLRLVSRASRQSGWVGVEGAWGSLADVSSEVVVSTVEVIARLAGRDVEWPQTVILDGAWHRVEAVARRWRRRQSGQLEMVWCVPEAHPAEQLAAVLRVAVDTGRVSAAEAELVWRFRVDDETSEATAAVKGCSVVALRKRRERAEHRLAAVGRAG